MSLPASEPWHRNLLHTFDELVDHLGDVVLRVGTQPDWPRTLVWDAFLTVCAASQVLDDFLHRGFSGLADTLGAVRVQPGKVGMLPFLPARLAAGLPRLVHSRTIGAVAMGVDAIVGARVRARVRWREHDLLELAAVAHEVACTAAPHLMKMEASTTRDAVLAAHLSTLHQALAARRQLPSLGERVLKIPACFKDFDCHPEDCAELARRFAARGGSRTAPVTVVGIRTSGSYLGPLCVAALRAQGYADVRLTSMRQKVPLFAAERSLLRARGQAGTVLVVDDPPVSGSTLCQVIEAIVRASVPAGHVVALVPADLDAPFFRSSRATRIHAVYLPRPDWRIARILPLIEPATDTQPVGTSRTRSHARTRTARTASVTRAGPSLLAKGTGVGWYAAHAEEAGSVLGEFVAAGAPGEEGVLLEQWVEGPSLAERPDACDEHLLRHIGSYVAARARRLAIHSGHTGDIEDRATGWQTLAATFARSYALLAPLAYGHLRRRLAMIGAAAPRAAIDGRMGAQKWILPVGGSRPVKVDFEEHAFDRADTAVLDPVLDLAAFSIDQGLSLEREAALVATYVQDSGDHDAGSRLACCKLIAGLGRRHHLDRLLTGGASGVPGPARGISSARMAAIERTRLDRRLSSTANRFLAAALDVGTPGESPEARLVAIDIDGVLEDGALGFTATSPAGVRALRTLKRHGYEPILASGRSLEEIIERARAFGLRAGIAEYGAVVWIYGVVFGLTSAEERAQLAALRALLASEAGVIVDDAYTHSVRVFRHDGVLRRAVSPSWLRDVLARERLGALRMVAGEDQIDVVGATCTKGRALRMVRERLGACEVHAVGDTAEDVAMLREADHAWTPANGRRATTGTGRPVRVARARLAMGLLEIARIIAHGRPRTCERCEPPTLHRHDRMLVEAFAIRDRGRVARMLDLLRPEALDPLWISR